MPDNSTTDPARMEKIVSLCKRKGFVFQSAEIYGGLNGCWDYGPLGAELKRNVKDYWWKRMVRDRDDIVGMDGTILTHHDVLKASGHVDTFSDPMIDCKGCNARHRADQLPEKKGETYCPNCGGRELGEPQEFNLMFSTHMGAVKDDDNIAFLRPETAQTIFTQFKNVCDQTGERVKLPFGIAQIGKAFRNEINPRNFTFRSREFEQMEIEFFCREEDGMRLTDEWLETRLNWYQEIGLPRTKLHVLDVPDGERAHYSKKTYDIEYEFPFGIQELEGVAYRTDYDLGKHSAAVGKDQDYFDEQTKERFIPHVVEPSAGADRAVLAVLCEAYDEETLTNDKGKEEVRTVMRFSPKIAPVKVAILPLLKNKEELVAKAREVEAILRPHMNITFDLTGAIGRRYRRQDEIGTPFCVTIDFDTIGQNEDGTDTGIDTVTLRHRDSMEQERLPIAELLVKILPEIA